MSENDSAVHPSLPQPLKSLLSTQGVEHQMNSGVTLLLIHALELNPDVALSYISKI